MEFLARAANSVVKVVRNCIHFFFRSFRCGSCFVTLKRKSNELGHCPFLFLPFLASSVEISMRFNAKKLIARENYLNVRFKRMLVDARLRDNANYRWVMLSRHIYRGRGRILIM